MQYVHVSELNHPVGQGHLVSIQFNFYSISEVMEPPETEVQPALANTCQVPSDDFVERDKCRVEFREAIMDGPEVGVSQVHHGVGGVQGRQLKHEGVQLTRFAPSEYHDKYRNCRKILIL